MFLYWICTVFILFFFQNDTDNMDLIGFCGFGDGLNDELSD